MKRNDRALADTSALRPIGTTLAAVVAGLSVSAQAHPVDQHPVAPPLEPTTNVRTHYVDPTNHPSFDEDPTMIVGPSEPTEVLGEAPAPAKQQDLFDL
ncbi:MAG: hypothetical protein ABUS48_01015 [Pseudomonadota bacterium]